MCCWAVKTGQIILSVLVKLVKEHIAVLRAWR